MNDASVFRKAAQSFRNDAKELRQLLESKNADSETWDWFEHTYSAMHLIADAIDSTVDAVETTKEVLRDIPSIVSGKLEQQ